MRKLVALPVLSADALSSVAYGSQAMLAVLVLAGLPGLSYSQAADAAMAFLMLAVGISYRQTIRPSLKAEDPTSSRARNSAVSPA